MSLIKRSFENIKKIYIYINETFKNAKHSCVFSSADRKPLVLTYISVLLVIMMVTAVFACVTTHFAVDFAKEWILEKNNRAISHIRASVDNDMREIMEYTLSAANDQGLLDFSKKTYSRDFMYEATSANLFPEPDNTNDSNIIVKTAVYFDDSEIMVSGTSAQHASTFFQEFMPVRGISYEQLHQLIKTTQNRRFIPAVDYYFAPKTVPDKCIMYVQPFPLTSTPRGKLITLIDCSQLVKSFADGFENSDSCFFITDQAGTLLYAVGNDDLTFPIHQISDNTSGTLNINGNKVLYSTRNAVYGNLKYIYTENADSIVKDISSFIVIAVICVLLMLALGSAVLVWLAQKICQPCVDMKSILRDCCETDKAEDENSVSAVDDDTDERMKSLPILETAEQSMRKNILSNILLGEFANATAIAKICEKNGIRFVSDDFCVIYFNLNEIVTPDIPIIKYAISNTVLEIFEPIALVFIDDTEQTSLSGIINLKNNVTGETDKQILEHLKFLRNFFTEQFGVSINSGAGNMVKGVENIPSSYSNAKEAAKYSILSGASDVLSYSRIKSRDYYYFYPLETESKLVFAAMNGDAEQVKQTIDYIVEANSMLTFDMYKCLFFDLTATALKIMSHKNIDISYISKDNNTPFERLTVCQTIKELTETIHDIFLKICGHTKDGHGVRKEKLKSAILEFIQKNYTNPNMSLAMLSDEFSMNYTYMSHFFKDFIGMNFIDYVSDLRVKKASELLRTTTMPITDISAAVGYANSTVLIKIFKKITGTTPGAYRKNIQ